MAILCNGERIAQSKGRIKIRPQVNFIIFFGNRRLIGQIVKQHIPPTNLQVGRSGHFGHINFALKGMFVVADTVKAFLQIPRIYRQFPSISCRNFEGIPLQAIRLRHPGQRNEALSPGNAEFLIPIAGNTLIGVVVSKVQNCARIQSISGRYLRRIGPAPPSQSDHHHRRQSCEKAYGGPHRQYARSPLFICLQSTFHTHSPVVCMRALTAAAATLQSSPGPTRYRPAWLSPRDCPHLLSPAPA